MTWSALKSLVPLPGQQPDFQHCLEAFPILEKAKATLQSAIYHQEGDVWTHTKMVCEELVGLDFYAQATDEQRQVMFLAALLHDVAKYRTTQVAEDTGHISQPGHSRKGAMEARQLLWAYRVPFGVRETICRIIGVHQVPFHAFNSKRAKQPAEFLVRKLSCELDISLLAAVAQADMMGRICPDKQSVLDDIELFCELAREEGCYGRPRAFADEHTRLSYFRGADVHPDYSLFQEPGSKVTLMSGLPASGKDTWVRNNHPNLAVVSFDDARAELGLKHGQNEGQAAHYAVDKAKSLLREKVPFVWNATHLSAQMLEKSLSLLFAYNAQVEIVYLEQPLETLLARNTRRDTTLSNKALMSLIPKWEVPLPTQAHCVRYFASLD